MLRPKALASEGIPNPKPDPNPKPNHTFPKSKPNPSSPNPNPHPNPNPNHTFPKPNPSSPNPNPNHTFPKPKPNPSFPNPNHNPDPNPNPNHVFPKPKPNPSSPNPNHNPYHNPNRDHSEATNIQLPPMTLTIIPSYPPCSARSAAWGLPPTATSTPVASGGFEPEVGSGEKFCSFDHMEGKEDRGCLLPPITEEIPMPMLELLSEENHGCPSGLQPEENPVVMPETESEDNRRNMLVSLGGCGNGPNTSCRSLHGFVPVTPEAEAPRCAKAASRCFSLRCDRHKVLTWEWMGASCYLRLGAALKRPV
ncbi:unnamed protein product [Pleuronectes platessa]|uniref:Uncharacterized protein n=1 Tax=Pleuronectes platessa TaxID=8262 RepID=A0A9N7YUX2_PLEPL|nr:unnamed protein product [Pleuronectes platessa]